MRGRDRPVKLYKCHRSQGLPPEIMAYDSDGNSVASSTPSLMTVPESSDGSDGESVHSSMPSLMAPPESSDDGESTRGRNKLNAYDMSGASVNGSERNVTAGSNGGNEGTTDLVNASRSLLKAFCRGARDVSGARGGGGGGGASGATHRRRR